MKKQAEVQTQGSARREESSNTYAALDLGSNSFHVLIASDLNGTIHVVDRHREMARLGEGLEKQRLLAPESIERGLEILARIGQRIRTVPHQNVRIVGTNALREARNSDEFIDRAETLLGHNIDVISGHEEGRLIYLAVAHGFESRANAKLVMDIGGGSTEFIVGNRFQADFTESLRIGCISMTERWFKHGRLTKKAMNQAIQDTQRELEVIESQYRAHGWDVCIGTSGSILAINRAIAQFTSEGITQATLAELTMQLLCFKHIENIDSNWCSTRRAQSLPGAVAILNGAFRTLGIKKLEVSNGALREGLLHELIGRAHHEDIREQSVTSLSDRFQIDEQHAQRIVDTALQLFDQIYPDLNAELEDERQLLRWSALIHELGMSVSHSAYHKHGAYLIENLNLPGFSISEQTQLAWLVRCHRRRIQVESHMPHQLSLHHLLALLRLAVTLRRNRSDGNLPRFKISKQAMTFTLEMDRAWLDAHQLTKLDLELEQQNLAEANIKLKIETV